MEDAKEMFINSQIKLLRRKYNNEISPVDLPPSEETKITNGLM